MNRRWRFSGAPHELNKPHARSTETALLFGLFRSCARLNQSCPRKFGSRLAKWGCAVSSSRAGAFKCLAARPRVDTAGADTNVEFAGGLLRRSLPSDRLSEFREERQCELDRRPWPVAASETPRARAGGRLPSHPDETSLLATAERAQTEGRDLANRRNPLVCKLRAAAVSAILQRNGGTVRKETP